LFNSDDTPPQGHRHLPEARTQGRDAPQTKTFVVGHLDKQRNQIGVINSLTKEEEKIQ